MLIASGYFFRRTTRTVSFSRDVEESTAKESSFLPVIIAGFSFGVIDAIVKELLPGWLMAKSDVQLPIHSGGLFVSMVLITAAIAAWPLSFQVDKIGERKGVIIGLSGALISLALVYFISSEYLSLVLALTGGVFLSLASVSAFPFALKNLSVKNVTLGTGIFFGCVELTAGLISILKAKGELG